MKNKISIFLACVLFFNIVKTDFYMAEVFEKEKQYLKKDFQYNLNSIEEILTGIFESCNNASEEERSLGFYKYFTYSISYTFDNVKYSCEYSIGAIYTNCKKLSSQEKSQLIEYAKNAMKDLQEKEIFGMRSISENITLYFLLTKIEKVTE